MQTLLNKRSRKHHWPKSRNHSDSVIHLRDLDKNTKIRIRSLLRYGDVEEISKRCDFITYNQVSNVLRGVSENDRVWKITLEYLNERCSIAVCDTLFNLIKPDKEVG